MADYPEHEKLKLVKDKSQICGAFIDWLEEQGIVLAERHEHNDGCRDEEGFWSCGYSTGELFRTFQRKERLLAKFFEIDLERLEKEKVAMLDEQRRLNERLR